MTIAVKRIILVTRDVQFAINVKRSLESLGDYAVTPVTEARNAIEQLRRKAHHLALLDISNLSIAPAVMIDLIRARQEDIAIVLGPDNPQARELARAYRLQGPVAIPVSSRALLPILESSLRDVYEALPKTEKLPAIEAHEDTVNIEALVDGLLDDQALPSFTMQKLQATYRLLHPDDDLDRQAAPNKQVELAIEAGSEDGSIRYRHLRENGNDGFSLENQAGSQDEETPLASPGEQTTVSDLGLALSQQAFGWSELATTAPEAQRAHLGDLGDLGKKLSDVESDFTTTRHLSGGGPGARHQFDADSTLNPSEHPGDLPTLGQTTLPALSERADELVTTVADSAAETAQNIKSSDMLPPPLYSLVDDPFVRQAALVMTQTMTELTAQATLLSRGNALLAFSGALQADELKALREAIKDDWSAQPGRARLRFISLPKPASGQARKNISQAETPARLSPGRADDQKQGGDSQFMLYSKATLDNLTLSLVFAGSQSLSTISQQGDRMLQAMTEAPASSKTDEKTNSEADVKPDDAVANLQPAASDFPAAALATQPLTFVWLVGDSATQLSQRVAQHLVFWLEVQFNNLGWTLRRLDVHEDFVYLEADLPKSAAPDQIAKNLMARSQRIARAEDPTLPQALWADAYLVLQPGRQLALRELQGFLSFAREQA